MTKQLVIKLNEEKFKPLLDKLMQTGSNISKTYSEVTAKCIFYIYLLMYEKRENLGNKTHLETILELEGSTATAKPKPFPLRICRVQLAPPSVVLEAAIPIRKLPVLQKTELLLGSEIKSPPSE